MKKVLAALLVIASPLPASAAIIHYTLQDVTLSDGGTAFGSFDADTSSGQLTAINVTTTAGSTFSGRTYTLANTVSPYIAGYYAYSYNADGTGYWQAAITTPSYLTLGTFALGNANFEVDYFASAARYATAGSVTSNAADVPEPAMLGLFGMGAFALAAARRRRAA